MKNSFKYPRAMKILSGQKRENALFSHVEMEMHLAVIL